MPRIDNNSLKDLFDNKYSFNRNSKVSVNALALIEELAEKQTIQTRLKMLTEQLAAQADRISYLEERLAYEKLISNELPFFNIKA
jgi:transcription elongation GreA/GreB family factor